MSVEALVKQVQDEFAAFKVLNDQRYEELKNGTVSPATQAKVDEVNSKISDLQTQLEAEADKTTKKIEELENIQNRASMGGRGFKLPDDRLVQYANWQTHFQGKHEEPVEPQDVDLELIRNYKKAFNQYLGTGQTKLLNEMSVGSDPDGGYWVDADMNGRLIEFIYETSPLRGLANAQSVTGDALEGEVDLGEAGDGWVGEPETRGETTTPQVAEWRIPLREQYAQPFLTQRIIDFANRDVAAWLERKVRAKFARSEATASVSGDGAKRLRGFLTYTAGVPGATVATWQQIEQVPSLAAAAITADGLINLVFALKDEYAAGAGLGMRRDTERQIRELKSGDGAYIWQPDFTQRAQARVLGLPIVSMADMPAVASNALAVVCANFDEAYQFVDSPIGVRVLRDNVTTKGKTKLYTTRYVGGDVVNFEAIKILKIAAS